MIRRSCWLYQSCCTLVIINNRICIITIIRNHTRIIHNVDSAVRVRVRLTVRAIISTSIRLRMYIVNITTRINSRMICYLWLVGSLLSYVSV